MLVAPPMLLSLINTLAYPSGSPLASSLTKPLIV